MAEPKDIFRKRSEISLLRTARRCPATMTHRSKQRERNFRDRSWETAIAIQLLNDISRFLSVPGNRAGNRTYVAHKVGAQLPRGGGHVTPSMNMKLVYRTAWLQFREISCSYTENLDSIAADARLVLCATFRASRIAGGSRKTPRDRSLGNSPSTDFTAKSRRNFHRGSKTRSLIACLLAAFKGLPWEASVRFTLKDTLGNLGNSHYAALRCVHRLIDFLHPWRLAKWNAITYLVARLLFGHYVLPPALRAVEGQT